MDKKAFHNIRYTRDAFEREICLSNKNRPRAAGRLSGDGREQAIRASELRIHEALNTPGTKSLSFESANLTDWDSRFVASFGIAPSNVERATLSFEDEDCQRACAAAAVGSSSA